MNQLKSFRKKFQEFISQKTENLQSKYPIKVAKTIFEANVVSIEVFANLLTGSPSESDQ